MVAGLDPRFVCLRVLTREFCFFVSLVGTNASFVSVTRSVYKIPPDHSKNAVATRPSTFRMLSVIAKEKGTR